MLLNYTDFIVSKNNVACILFKLFFFIFMFILCIKNLKNCFSLINLFIYLNNSMHQILIKKYIKTTLVRYFQNSHFNF